MPTKSNKDSVIEAPRPAGPIDFKPNLAAFKQEAVVRLPTGVWMQIRRVSLSSITRTDKIPDDLKVAALRIAEGNYAPPMPAEGAPSEDGEAAEEANVRHYAAFDALVAAIVVSPKIVLQEEAEDEESLWVGRLIDVDKRSILDYTTSTVAYLDELRGQFEAEMAGEEAAATG
jgi:hypothetical protein